MEDYIPTNPDRFEVPIQPARKSIEPSAPSSKGRLTLTFAAISAVSALVGALGGIYGARSTNIATVLYTDTLAEKRALESQIGNLKGEKQRLEEEIKNRTDYTVGLENEIKQRESNINNLQLEKKNLESITSSMLIDIENQKNNINKLQFERKKYEAEVSNLNKQRKLLEDTNLVLKEKNYDLERNIKLSLLQAFVYSVLNYLNALEDNPIIEVLIGIPGEIGGRILQTRYSLQREFDNDTWNNILNYVKNRFEAVASVEAHYGKKRK